MSTQRETQPAEPQGVQTATGLVTQESKALQEVISGVFGQFGSRALHNFGTDRQQIWKLTSLATGPDCLRATDYKDKEIPIKYFYVHAIQLEGDSPGEFSDAIRCVLITPTYDAIAFVSNGIAADLARIVSAFGLEEYTPPVLVKLREFETRGRRRMYSLQPV